MHHLALVLLKLSCVCVCVGGWGWGHKQGVGGGGDMNTNAYTVEAGLSISLPNAASTQSHRKVTTLYLPPFDSLSSIPRLPPQ